MYLVSYRSGRCIIFSFLHEAGMISGSRSQICTLENQVQNYVGQGEEVVGRCSIPVTTTQLTADDEVRTYRTVFFFIPVSLI